MNLSRLKFREMKIPTLTYFLILTSVLLFVFGAMMNFIVIQENQGRMPVWNSYNIINTEEHFTITNISEVNQLQFADIFHIKGNIWSLGDFFLLFGLSFFIISLMIMGYNILIDITIRFKLNKAYKKQFK